MRFLVVYPLALAVFCGLTSCAGPDQEVRAHTVYHRGLDLSKDAIFPCIWLAEKKELHCAPEEQLEEIRLQAGEH